MGSRNQFKREEDWLRYKSNENKRTRVNAKLNYDEAKQNGTCNKCKSKCSINPRTNKSYWLCDNHLLKLREKYNASNLETPIGPSL